MVRKTYMPEQIINKLRETEILISQGIPIAEATLQTDLPGGGDPCWV